MEAVRNDVCLHDITRRAAGEWKDERGRKCERRHRTARSCASAIPECVWDGDTAVHTIATPSTIRG